MVNISLAIVKWLNRFLALLGLRRGRHFGVIYDSVTKQPVDPVAVKLLDAKTGKVLQTCIANLKGEYGFVAPPGRYRIFAQRANYRFPSERVFSKHDGVYKNIYNGEVFEFFGNSDVISLNIPLDPLAADFNQQDKQRLVKVHTQVEDFVHTFTALVFWLGFFSAVYFFWVYQTPVWLYIVAAFILVLLLAIVLPTVRLWGRVVSKKTGKPIAGATVSLAHASLPDIVIAKATTTEEGKYFIRIDRGKYILKAVAPDNASLKPITIRVGSEGLVNSEIRV